MSEQSFTYECSNGIGKVTISCPAKKNALTEQFFREFPLLIEGLSASGEKRPKVLILTNAGDVFCSGIDLKLLSSPELLNVSKPEDRSRLMSLVEDYQGSIKAIVNAPIPVIAAVDGPCIGAGMSLVSACDYRYATRRSYFSIEEVKRNLMADLGVLQLLSRQIPAARLSELAYSGMSLNAEQACQWGFTSQIYDDREAMDTAVRATAAGLSVRSSEVLKQTKLALRYAMDHSFDDAMAHAALLQAALLSPEKIMETFTNNPSPKAK